MKGVLRIGLSRDCRWVLRGRIPRALKGCDVVIFPELVDGGYAALARGKGRHTLGDALQRSFARLTRRGVPVCVAGSVLLKRRGGNATNASLVYHRGRLIHCYDKIHLFRPAGDARYFSPGRRIGTFLLPRGPRRLRAGVILCYDLRFPELSRAMARQGMQILIVPARWPAARDLAWRTLLRARAIENQIFVVGCNGPGAEGGPSYVFDPLGGELFSTKGKNRKAFWSVSLPLQRLEESRRFHDNLRDAVVLRSATIPLVRRRG
jgi:omega-amidase